MTRTHEARPDHDWDAPGGPFCGLCAKRIIEAVYTPGWLHAQDTPHSFAPFRYSDGKAQVGGGCLDCALDLADPNHAGRVGV